MSHDSEERQLETNACLHYVDNSIQKRCQPNNAQTNCIISAMHRMLTAPLIIKISQIFSKKIHDMKHIMTQFFPSFSLKKRKKNSSSLPSPLNSKSKIRVIMHHQLYETSSHNKI